MAAALGEIFSRGFRFNPTPLEAATYYLPRLIAGAPLHDAVRPLIHHADVYAREPGDLAHEFSPMPKTGDRFFFSCGKKGARAAGPGSWYLQSTKAVVDGAAKVGQVKKFRYKKGGAFTDWLMDEFSSTLCSEEAVASGGGQFVFCKIYVSPRAAPDSAARHESAAFLAPPVAPPPAVASTHVAAAFKRPAPQSAEPHCLKRMRVAAAAPTPSVVTPAGYCTAFFAPPPPCVPRLAAAPAPTRLAVPPPSRSPAPAPAPPRTLVQPTTTTQQMPPTTLPVVQAVHLSDVPAVQAPAPHCRPQAPSEKTKQRTCDPFEAVQQRYEAEEEMEMVAAPDPKESPPAALDEDDILNELKKAMEDDLPTGESSTVTDDEMGQHIASMLEDKEVEFNYD
ncbi:unnamed protein product [Urochloa decumbens]|uniref:NAC domain-containing protein n=1 Tax=Urochloa decumbens TaxID=240449 RepID=A0ABC8WBK2_9POAL